ncbi:MAG: site-specific DNA-methyltransferase [Chloroflexi bacterium]|nr:site-specific DNA-methyltransferase [Chloroflexota bacterium]
MKNIPTSSVDLIYLDPPFNSQRNYNLIYKKLTGQPVPEQEEAFCDAWEMDPEKEEMVRRMPVVFQEYGVDESLVKFWQAWIAALRNTNPQLLAYLIYMSYRLFEMKRILNSRGSIYLHCDSNASHYMKVIMDGIFGHNNFRNEILWKRTTAHNTTSRRYGDIIDTILFYSKNDDYYFKPPRKERGDDYIASFYRHIDKKGRRYRLHQVERNAALGIRPNLIYEYNSYIPEYGWMMERPKLEALDAKGRLYWSKNGRPQRKIYLDEVEQPRVGNLWDDIPPVHSQSGERLGYPTQKPIALLKRIITASCDEAGVVFDPFCGCGTAIYAAHLLNRKWIGCDIAILAIRLVRDILLKRYGLEEDKNYIVRGIPRSVEAAQELFTQDPRQFQHWAVELAQGFASSKFSGDRGIDGRIHFETNEGLKNMVLSVKGGGKPMPAWMRELAGVVQREEDTKLGGLILLESPTKGMRNEEASGGIYTYQGKDYHRLQIRTIQELLDRKWFDTPSMVKTLGKSSQTIMPV